MNETVTVQGYLVHTEFDDAFRVAGDYYRLIIDWSCVHASYSYLGFLDFLLYIAQIVHLFFYEKTYAYLFIL